MNTLLINADDSINRVRVKGTFGYDVSSINSIPDDLPPMIRRATTILAGVYTNQSRREQVGLDGSRSSLLEYDIPDEVKKLIKKHKRLVF